jgi:hypothetical protein
MPSELSHAFLMRLQATLLPPLFPDMMYKLTIHSTLHALRPPRLALPSAKPHTIPVRMSFHVSPPQTMTETFAGQLLGLISPDVLKPGQNLDELTFISIDANGVDVRLRCGSQTSVERINFGRKARGAPAACLAYIWRMDPILCRLALTTSAPHG